MRSYSRGWTYLIIGQLSLSILILLKVYLENRSFFLDEANLVRNIIELDYLNFFSSLRYEQFAPPMYLVLQKAVTQIMGVTPMIFRLISVVSAVAGLILFYNTIKHHFVLPVQFFSLMLLGFSPLWVRYGTEAKQYALDLFMSCLALWIIVKIDERGVRSWAVLSFIGIMGVWLSMPFAFCLAGLGIFLVYRYRAQRENVFRSILVIKSWLMSFIVLYFVLLQDGVSSSYLSEYHSSYFFGRNGNTVDQFASIYRMILDKTLIPIVFGIVFTGLGVFYQFKEHKSVLQGVLIPVLAMLIASSFGYYSLLERLMMFSIPFLIYLISKGMEGCISENGKSGILRVGTYTFISLISVVFLWKNSTLRYLFEPLKIEQGKELLHWVHTSTQGPVYLTPNAVPFYEVYGKLLDDHLEFDRPVYVRLSDIGSFLDPQGAREDEPVIVFVDIHTFGDDKQLYEQFCQEVGITLHGKYLLNADAKVIKISSGNDPDK